MVSEIIAVGVGVLRVAVSCGDSSIGKSPGLRQEGRRQTGFVQVRPLLPVPSGEVNGHWRVTSALGPLGVRVALAARSLPDPRSPRVRVRRMIGAEQ